MSVETTHSVNCAPTPGECILPASDGNLIATKPGVIINPFIQMLRTDTKPGQGALRLPRPGFCAMELCAYAYAYWSKIKIGRRQQCLCDRAREALQK